MVPMDDDIFTIRDVTVGIDKDTSIFGAVPLIIRIQIRLIFSRLQQQILFRL